MTDIVPDRPWATREYGRLRLNEGYADELLAVLTNQLDDLHSNRLVMKESGRSVTEINRRIRRISGIRSLLHGMMHEKGWCACEAEDEI